MAINFAREFNQRLGNYTGSRATPYRGEGAVDSDANKQNQLLAIAIREIVEEQSKKAKGLPTVSDERAESLKRAAVLRGTRELESDNGGGGLLGGLKDVGGGIWGGTKWAMDELSRPYYGVSEALKEQSESKNEGQPWTRRFDDIFGGLWSGVQKKERTGFGEVVEENSKRPLNLGWDNLNPFTMLGEGISEFDDAHPTAAKWIKRDLGFVGEIFLDPLNYMGVGVAGKIGKGANYTSDALKALLRGKTDEAIKAAGIGFDSSKARFVKDIGTDGKPVARWASKGELLDTTISRAIDDTLLEITGGASKGRVLGVDTLPTVVATKVAEHLRTDHFEAFDKAVGRFASHLDNTTPLSVKDLNKLKADPMFQDFLDELISVVNKGRNVNRVTNFDQLKKAIRSWSPTSLTSAVREAAENIKHVNGQAFKKLQDDLTKTLTGSVYNAPALRVAGKKLPISRVGSAYAGFRRSRLSSDAAKALSHSKQLPGRTSLMTQRLRSLGVKNYEIFRKSVVATAKQLTKAERHEITNAIVKGFNFSDPRLQSAKEFVQAEYKRMLDEEIAAGVRGATKAADNYVYLYYKGGSAAKIKAARERLKDSIKRTGRIDPDLIKIAKEGKLKPIDDAFEALLTRKIKSNRDLTRSWFMQDLIDHYGIVAKNLTSPEIHGRHLKQITGGIPETLKASLKEGENFYLPKDVEEFFTRFMEMSRLGSNADLNSFIRIVDNLTRLFKATATIPYPGFHIRNMIGDIFMGFLDGVKGREYTQILLDSLKTKKGMTVNYKIGGKDFSFSELWDMFKENAASGGFYRSDLGISEKFAKADPSRIWTGLRKGSEGREDFGRFVHFVHAFREEFPQAATKIKNKDKALTHAIEASTYRVNKFLFDYGALTPVEKNVLRRVIPFYTYTRKVMPTILESMMLSPANLARTNRWFQSSHLNGENFDPLLVPDYLREMGYATLTDEEEPWLARGDVLPTNIPNTFTNLSDPMGLANAASSMFNPYMQILPELGTGEEFFTGREIESVPDYLLKKLAPFYSQASSTFGGQKSTQERVLTGRLGLGLPLDKLSTAQQDFAYRDLEDELYANLEQINSKIRDAGYRVYLGSENKKPVYKVRDTNTDEVLVSTTDINKAIKDAMALADRR